MSCPSPKAFRNYAQQFNDVEINEDTEKNMRFNVWNVKPSDVHNLINNLTSEGLPGREESSAVLKKINNALKRVKSSNQNIDSFVKDIIGSDKDNIDENNVRKAIALHEVMEAIKGESDKARNNDISLEGILVEGTLPALPLSRIAASIGRKSLYTKKTRFKSTEESPKIAAEIEQLYYVEGLNALRELQDEGYVDFHTDHPTLRDYTDSEKKSQKYESGAVVTTLARSVSIKTEKLGMVKSKKSGDSVPYTPEESFFLDRTPGALDDTYLGAVVDVLTAVKHVTQASTLVIPDLGTPNAKRKLADSDPQGFVADPKSDSARQKLYDAPLYVNTTVHKLLKMLHEETLKSEVGDSSAIKVIMKSFGESPLMVQSLFGIKESDNFSIDRQESVAGQNRSKTVPLDDIVESYNILSNDNGDPIGLHMAMKGGRNQRLYYENSIINAHASKQARHMLTSGKQTIEVGSDNFERIVYAVIQSLDDSSLTYADIVEGGNKNLDQALESFKKYDSAKNVKVKLAQLSRLPSKFPGVDFAALLSALSGVNDIRNIKEGDTSFSTEFMDSADATAQGGTLTLQQALATEVNVESFMERTGLFTDKDGNLLTDPDKKLNDIYGLMSEGIKKFVDDDNSNTVEIESNNGGSVREVLKQTLDLLFGGDKKGQRDLSKEATMPFIYGQGKGGAVSSMSNSIANRIVDNLSDPKTKEYLSILLDDKTIVTDAKKVLKDIKGLHISIKDALKAKGIPLQLFKIMENEIDDVYLESFKEDGKNVFELALQVKDSHKLKVLPLGAVLAGVKIEEIEKYGMPLTKVVEVSSPVTGPDNDPLVKEGGHTVLTRKQQLFKTIMDVSVTHGMDSGLMYHALDNVMDGSSSGAIIVHDQVIGSVDLVRKVETEYVKLNSQLIAKYDTHQQILEGIAFYDPELAQGSRYKKLKAKIDERVKAKAKMIADGRLNLATDALIGDGLKYKEFANATRKSATSSGTNPVKKEQEASAKAKKSDAAAVERARAELKDIFNKFPETLFTYDIETSGLKSSSFIVQFGYKKGTEDTVSVKVALTEQMAKEYIDNFAPSSDPKTEEKLAGIRNGSVYKAIKASYEDGKQGMFTWNQGDKSNMAVDPSEIKGILKRKSANSYIASFNGLSFDDSFVGLKTDYDMIRLAKGTTTDSKQFVAGRLVDFFDSSQIANAHSADADVDLTVELAKQFVAGTVKNMSPKLKAGNSTATTVKGSGKDQTALLKTFANESRLVARFLEMSGNPAVQGDTNSFNTETNEVSITGTDQGRDNGKVKPLGEGDRKLQLELIEHEIVHHNTAAYIAKAMDDKNNSRDTSSVRDIVYFNKAIKTLRNLVDSYSTLEGAQKLLDILGEEAQDRVKYILNSGTESVQVAEFVAIMSSEPEIADAIYRAVANKLPTKTLKARISDFIKKFTDTLLSITNEDFASAIDVNKLQAALVRTLENGRSFKEEQIEEAISHEKGFMQLNAGPQDMSTVRYLNSVASSVINSRIERGGKRLAGKLHANLKLLFPLYTDASAKINGLYEGSEALKQLVYTITGEGTNKTSKADLLSQSAKIQSAQRSSIAYQQNQFKKAFEGVDKGTKKTIGRFVTQLPLHEYFVNSTSIDTADKIDAEVTRLEAELPKSVINDVDNLIERNVKRDLSTTEDEKEGGNIYNLSTKYMSSDSDKYGSSIRSLLALKSIQTIGSKEFESFLGMTDLVNLVKDNVLSNKINLMSVGGTEGMNDSLIPEYWKEAPQFVSVTVEGLRSFQEGEEAGWVMLREPKQNRLGIMYKELVDSTELQGAHTDIQLSSTDIDVTDTSQQRYSNVVKSGANGYKLVLTPKEKQTAGIEEDFVEALIRGTAHSMAVSESQVIRDAIVMSENRFDGTDSTKLDDLKSILSSDNVDAPWFVKLATTQTSTSLDPAIRATYKVVAGRASNVVGSSGSKFSEEVHLVRKDMAHILIGGHEKSLFKNKQLKWATRILKDLMAGTKIGMVVLNPKKIAIDNMSNIAYLGVSGASPLFIAENYKEIARDYHAYQNLVQDAVELKVKMSADEDNEQLKNKLAKIQKKIDENPVGDLDHKGFINSLGSDLVVKSSDASSGLQADMDTALKYMLKNKKGNTNLLGHFIQSLYKIGFQSEDFVKYLGGIVGRSKDGKAAEQQLDLAVERIKNIKSEKDIVSYVSQYTTSPGSELVRVGSSMSDLTDVLAKETLYRHAMQNENMTSEQARIHVLDSFPDYKENLPMAIKQLSDIGIIMFPSFWLRIQKAIYRMAKDKPVNLSAELAIEQYLTGNLNTVFDANIINKSGSFGGIFHMPLDSAGVGSVIPTNVFNY